MQLVHAAHAVHLAMELTFWEMSAVGAVILIVILCSNITIHCLNKKLVLRLAMNSEREISKIRNQISSLEKTLSMQQSALLRIRQQRK